MFSPTYMAVLGRQPELGLVELESRLGAAAVRPFGPVALLDQPLALAEFGGIIKLARVIAEVDAARLDQLVIDPDLLPQTSKVIFGVSHYGRTWPPRLREAWALELKKALRSRGQSARYVAPKPGQSELTAAQLKFNGLPAKGFELVLAWQKSRVVVALTEQIQDIDWYGRRDYERPARSAKVGMLPPKLAQVLLNTTSASTIVDPFCGTGVVLQEALLTGRMAVGSDLSPEMVEASRTNLDWLGRQTTSELPHWTVAQADARSAVLPSAPCAVVSEGYLGPNLTQSPAPAALVIIQQELRGLYRDSLACWATQLAVGADVALCVPAWRTTQGTWSYLDLVDDLAALGYTSKVFKHVSAPLLYARSDQIVGRQLLLLRKN